MSFDAILGQEHAVRVLQGALASGKVPHAYLFEGPPGVGKRLAARTLALALNCRSSGPDACGACSDCRKIGSDVHPDVRWLGLPEGKRRIPIEAVREQERWLAIGAHEGLAKLLVIEPADQLSDAAANALLKTLEEPRAGSFIVLVTAAASALLPTVRSRCQRVRFAALPTGVVERLLEGQGLAPEEARVLAALSGGSLDRALSWAGEDIDGRLDRVLSLLEGAAGTTPGPGLDVTGALRGEREEATAVLELALRVLHELLWLRTGGLADGAGSGLGERLGPRFEALAGAGGIEEAARGVAAVNRALTAMQRNNMNPQLAVEGALLAMRGRATIGAGWDRIGAGGR
jgi:DNA polymerase-3 subunit delta'